MESGGNSGGGDRSPAAGPGRPPTAPFIPVGYRGETWAFLGAALVGVLLLFSIRCAHGPQTAPLYPSRTLPADVRPVLLDPPPMDSEYFPCSDCHEDEPTDRTVRQLEDDHEDLVLAHGKTWCLDCHDADRRDQLHLADGRPVEFEESWRLCTQCHGAKLPDWRAGVHGKRTGNWWGPKEYWSCVACHDPHSPRFRPLEPMPPPLRPEAITRTARSETGVTHEAP